MATKTILGLAMVLLAASLAGCVGGFEVHQTEPIRVELEGEPQYAQVKDDDSEPQRFVVENPERVGSVDIEVQVTRVSEKPLRVVVVIEDPETEDRLAEEEILIGHDDVRDGDLPDEDDPDGNETGPTANGTTEQTVTQVIHVDVKGKDNFVVVTQATEGDADVAIGAKASDGGALDEADDNGTWEG